MDIKEKIEQTVEKIKSDKDIKSKFEKDPVKTVEEIIGVDLPDDIINKVISGVKAKLTADTVGDVASKLGGFFKKK